MTTIRMLLTEDASALNRLTKDALREYPASYTSCYSSIQDRTDEAVAAHLTELNTTTGFRLGAFDDSDQLVGTVRVAPRHSPKQSHIAEVLALFVRTPWQSRGIGRLLLTSAIEQSREIIGISQLELTVSSEAASALHLYKSMGFEVTGKLKNHIRINNNNLDCYTLWLPINPDT